MPDSRDYLEMIFHSINCFANDGVLDVGELEQIVEIAKRDGVVDDNEKRVLSNIFSRLNSSDLTPALIGKVEGLKKKFEL